jgi:hypothetical protein
MNFPLFYRLNFTLLQFFIVSEAVVTRQESEANDSSFVI